jgi:hypothetical protein
MKQIIVAMTVGSILFAAAPAFHEEKGFMVDTLLYARSFTAHGEKSGDSCWFGLQKDGKGVLIRAMSTVGQDRFQQVIEVREGKKTQEYWLLGDLGERETVPEYLESNLFANYRDAVKKLDADVRKTFAGYEGIK